MSEVLGPVAYGSDQTQMYFGQNQRNYSEEVAGEIDKEVHKYMEEAYESCRTIINENREKLDRIAQALIDKETLTAAELKEIVFGESSSPLIELAKKIPDEPISLTKENPAPVLDNSNPTPI